MREAESQEIDLEIRVTIAELDGNTALKYILHSPSGAADFYHREIRGEELRESPEEFRTRLVKELDNMPLGYGVGGARPGSAEAAANLENLGRELYDRLFQGEMRVAYRRFRTRARTLLITSDEPWIPWELVRPFDDEEPDELIDDDFLCLRFELTRWLTGDVGPAAAIGVGRLACIDAGESPASPPLPSLPKERELLARLAQASPGVVDDSIADATLGQLTALLERGGVGLLHFAGHGGFHPRRAHEARIQLADQPFLARSLRGPMQTQLKHDRPLIFLNACQVGQQGWVLTGLGGWVERWIRGCHCGAFIAPQWAVTDHLAHEFARAFYAAVEEGRTFGQAAIAAREQVRALQPGDPTWLAYHVYAHPNGRLILGSTAPAPRPRDRTTGEVRSRILDQGRFIAEKTAGFVGREWIFEAIDRFVREEPRGYFLVRGDPGIGKSALIAELVRREGYVHHFNIRAEGKNRSEDFLTNICAQLIAAYGLSYTFLPPEAARDSQFFKSLLEKISEQLRARGEKLVILIDALDEVDIAGQPAGVNTLQLPTTLPPGVYLVATSRRVELPLRLDCELRKFDLGQDDQGNLADVRAFIESKLVRPGIRAYLSVRTLDDETFVVEMVDKSQGNFMYLRHVLPEIEKGAYQTRDFSALPVGLENYYEDHWSRMRTADKDAWFTYRLPVLVALTVVKEPVSIDLIREFSGITERPRIRTVLTEWDAFLYCAAVTDEEGQVHKRYRLYHDTFHDFIAGKDEVEGERVDLKAAHGKIADVLWQELYGEE